MREDSLGYIRDPPHWVNVVLEVKLLTQRLGEPIILIGDPPIALRAQPLIPDVLRVELDIKPAWKGHADNVEVLTGASGCKRRNFCIGKEFYCGQTYAIYDSDR